MSTKPNLHAVKGTAETRAQVLDGGSIVDSELLAYIRDGGTTAAADAAEASLDHAAAVADLMQAATTGEAPEHLRDGSLIEAAQLVQGLIRRGRNLYAAALVGQKSNES